MLSAPNRQRTRHRTSSVKHGVSSEDFRSHIKLDGWKNAYLSTNPDPVPFEGRAQKLADKLSDARVVSFLHLLLAYILARVAAGTDWGLAQLPHCFDQFGGIVSVSPWFSSKDFSDFEDSD